MNRFSAVAVVLFAGLFASFKAQAYDLPGGQLWTASPLAAQAYEWSLSRSLESSQYWASRLRTAVTENASVGLAFGAGISSFHLGAEGAIHLTGGTNRLAIAWVSGGYFRRITPESFAVLRTGPVTSYSARVGKVVFNPYVGFYGSPSWRMSDGKFESSFHSVFGNMLEIRSAAGLQIWTEASLGLDARTEFVLGVALPFAVL